MREQARLPAPANPNRLISYRFYSSRWYCSCGMQETKGEPSCLVVLDVLREGEPPGP
jgi:hypothetical protein